MFGKHFMDIFAVDLLCGDGFQDFTMHSHFDMFIYFNLIVKTKIYLKICFNFNECSKGY